MIEKKIKISKLTLKNRIVISPMCQYSANKGCPSSWHYAHLGSFATSGAGMLIIESTAVNMKGRITLKDLCLKTKKQFLSFKKLIKFIRSISNIPICLQISHSGRKGSSNLPWLKNNGALKKKEGSWTTFSASKLAKDKNWPTPKELKKNQIKKIVQDFCNTARLAKKLNIDGIEMHMAHGYLIHQFLSPISNRRNDEYGGKFENRIRFSISILKKIKKIWPKNKILGVRITASDHLENGIELSESVKFAKIIEKIGVNYVCVSSGGIISKTKLKPNKKAFRLNLAKIIKKKINIPVGVTGNMHHKKILENALSKKKIDFVAIGRPFLKNPRWLFNNLIIKGVPKQLERGF